MADSVAETHNNNDAIMRVWCLPHLVVCCWQMKDYLWSHCNSLFKHRHKDSSPFHSRLNCVYWSFTLKLSFKHFQGGIKFYFRINNVTCVCLALYFKDHIIKLQFSLVAQLVKSLSAVQETWVLSLGREDPLEKEMANHSSILA